ncbi:MAG: RNA-binding domain-containing protein [Candidatus Micrarchaeota archaeon]
MIFSYPDLQRWVSEWEGPALEFKLSVQKEVGETICAFANTYGGIIVFGVEPKKKELRGIPNPDEESQRLRNVLELCKPNPKPEQEFIRHEGKTFIVLKIEAFPYSQNPCFFSKRCYIRQGTTNLELSGEELIDFLKKRALLNFEESKSKATLEDLDKEKIFAFFKKRGLKTENLTDEDLKPILAGLNVANYNGEFFLKNASILFFAKEPQRFLSNLEVRIVKYSGTEPAVGAIVLDKRFYGVVPDLIDLTFNAVSENIGKTLALVGTTRETILDYPPDSLREVITNAFGHRDYFESKDVIVEIFEDRLEITNPGGLLPGQNIKNFDKTPRHRNPIVYRLLHDLGKGEGLGLGIRLIRKQFRQVRLPDPEFYEIGNAFKVILYNMKSRKRRYSDDFQNQRQKQALAYLEKNPILKTVQYAKMTGVSKPTAVKDLNELVKQGKLRKIGKYRGARYELVKNIK